MEETVKAVLDSIRVITHLKGITMSDLAGKIERTPANLSQKLAGGRGLSVAELALIASALDCSPRDFFMPVENMTTKETEEMLMIGRWLDQQSIPIKRKIFKMGLAALNVQRTEERYSNKPEDRFIVFPELSPIL
jgi:transcriptional regulator with XRE-family HTH domain